MIRLSSVLFLIATLIAAGAYAQQEVKFPTAPSDRLPEKSEVEAILALPVNASGKVPAVVMIHTGGGYDAGQSRIYAAPLREAGFATLELVLFRAATTKFPVDFLPHTFGALKYLSAHPQIEPTRVGIMGLSLGGLLSMYSASSTLADEHLGGGTRFAAHVPVYPVCWVHEAIARGTLPHKILNNSYAKLTGAPVHIIAGEKDQIDDPDGCQKFLQALSPDARKSVELTVFPGASHAWDNGKSVRYFDRIACRGKGCMVDIVADADVTAKGRQVVVDFFVKQLKTK